MLIHKPLLVLSLFVVAAGISSSAQEQSNRKVAPMSEDDRKLTKCEVHKSNLYIEDVQIAYAHPDLDYLKDMLRDFPHANTCAMGGCVYQDGAPTWQTVKFCLQCRQAEKKWLDDRHLEHP